MWTIVTFSLISLGYGIYAMSRSGAIAERNRELIDSGREEYFEQRRAWEAYNSTPPSEAGSVRQRGRREIIWGLVGLAGAAAIYFIDYLK